MSGGAGATDDDHSAVADMGVVKDAASRSFVTGSGTRRSEAGMGDERAGWGFWIRGSQRQGRPEEGDQPGGGARSPVAGVLMSRELACWLVGCGVLGVVGGVKCCMHIYGLLNDRQTCLI